MPYSRLVLALALAGCVQVAQADAGACRYVPIATVPISASPHQQMIIEGSIDDKPGSMLVDTGSSATLLMRSSAEQRGLTLHPTGQHIRGVGGPSSLYAVHLKDFAAAGAHSGKTTLKVIGDTSMQHSFDAILGVDFLMQADMEIALADNQLKFYRATSCADTFLAYWDKDAMEIPFARASGRRKAMVEVQVNGQTMTALIDTGASHSSIDMAAAKRLGMGPDAAGVVRDGEVHGIGTDQAPRYRAVFDSFTIGSETIKNAAIPIVERSDKAEGVYEVILGMDFLRAHRVLFANSQDRLYLTYLGGDVFAKPQKFN